MATSLEILQGRVTDVLTNLEDVKTGLLVIGEQIVPQDEINTQFNTIDAKVDEIKQIINPTEG